MIIALCGESGAGKSTSTAILREAGFPAYSLSGIQRAEAETRYGTPTREQVQNHGRDMQARHGNAYYARRLIETTDLFEQERAVVDGMRNPDEVELLRTTAAERGLTLLLLAVVLDSDTRFERVRGRSRAGDALDRGEFDRADARANGSIGDFQDNRALIAAADLLIENTGGLDALRARLVHLATDASRAGRRAAEG